MYVTAPELPDGFDWPERTRAWWQTWRNSPQATAMTASDWDFLLDTALLHAQLWSGDTKAATELRLRVAKFGATPEDRMRLRLQASMPPSSAKPADDGEDRPSRYGHLRSA